MEQLDKMGKQVVRLSDLRFFFRAGLIAHARRPDDKWQHSEKHANIIGIINAGLGARR